jgi:hypothetical protein
VTFRILANLDQEARWAGQPLPASVLARISRAASLVAALAPDDRRDVTVWAPTVVNRGFLVAQAGWQPPMMFEGTPDDAPDLVWADPRARDVNDRRFALDVQRELGVALPTAAIVESIAQLDACLAASPPRRWVCKARLTTAGRDRYIGDGDAFDRAAITSLLAGHRALVFEPWLDRIADFGVCARVDREGKVAIDPPHELFTSERGTFRAIALAPRDLTVAEHDQLVMTADHVGIALHRAGYAGPFGIDAFAYRDGDRRALRPLCEINARYTFGHVARALLARTGGTTLGFGASPPPDARVIVAPHPNDPSSAWVE